MPGSAGDIALSRKSSAEKVLWSTRLRPCCVPTSCSSAAFYSALLRNAAIWFSCLGAADVTVAPLFAWFARQNEDIARPRRRRSFRAGSGKRIAGEHGQGGTYEAQPDPRVCRVLPRGRRRM